MHQKSLNRLNKSEYDESSHSGEGHGDSDGESIASGISKKSTKLTPKRYWTRVLSYSYRLIDCEAKFDIAKDISIDEGN